MNIPDNWNNPKITPETLKQYTLFLENIEDAFKIKFNHHIKLKNIKFFETMFLYVWNINWIQSYAEYNNYTIQYNFDIKHMETNIHKNLKDIESWNILLWFYIDHNNELKNTKRMIVANKNSKAKTLMRIVKEKLEDSLLWWKVIN